MNLEERLNDIIEDRDFKIEELEEKIEELKNFNSLVDTAYQRHFTIKDSGIRDGLPFPRLEMIFEYLDGDRRYGYKWIYGMVMKPYSFMTDSNDLLFIPFSVTRGSGSSDMIRNGKHELPYRDGMHIMKESEVLNLPAYIINEEENHCEKIENDKSIGNKSLVKSMARK